MLLTPKEFLKIAEDAGKRILAYYENEIEVELKQDHSPLTQADLAAHHVIVAALKEQTPNIPIISEESGVPDFEVRSTWKQFWLVDPLDGTKEFIKKNGEFTVNIAMIENEIPVFGVVYIPAKNITYYGQKGQGSFKIDSSGNKRRIFSGEPDFKNPLKVVTSRSHKSDQLEEKLSRYGIKIGEQIPAGSSLKFCLVAEGRADLYPRMGPTMEWDTAAGDAVYRYAGRNGANPSPLRYNKPDLKNGSFIIGVDTGGVTPKF